MLLMPQANDHHPDIDLRGLPQAGETFDDKYRIDGILGFGGMGVVFAATHLRLAERVAIKMLLPEWLTEPTIVERFEREGRASAAIRSEHIVRVLDVDECEGRPYLVLEYLEGQDFDALVSESGALPVASAVDFILQACEALAEAHALGTIHRDLKPANLFLTHRADGSPCVKVLDFGISKVNSRSGRSSQLRMSGTQPMTVMGSPHYMSPEQMRSATDVDARADIWSLGAILHELLAGSPPFDGETITALCAHVMGDPPQRLEQARSDVPPALQGVVLRCLEKDPARRYSNVAELSHALAVFGSDAAHASAARIARVVELGINPGRAYPGTDARRARIVSDISVPRAIKRPVGAYVLAVLAVLGLLAGVGWKIAKQSLAIRAAEREAPVAVLAPAVTSGIPPVPIPSSVASTTSAFVSAPIAALAPIAAPAPHVHVIPPHVHHAHPSARTHAQVGALVNASPTSTSAPVDAPPATARNARPAPADPNDLFDQRK